MSKPAEQRVMAAEAAAADAAASASASGPAPSGPAPRLLLNFDINKTVIICDPVSGTDLAQMCEVLLTDYCWGRVTGGGGGGGGGDANEPAALVWHCISTEPTLTPPASAGADGANAQLGRRAAGSRGSSRRGSDADATKGGSGTNSPAMRPKAAPAGAAGSPLHLSVSAAAAVAGAAAAASISRSASPAPPITAAAVAARIARLDLGAPAVAAGQPSPGSAAGSTNSSPRKATAAPASGSPATANRTLATPSSSSPAPGARHLSAAAAAAVAAAAAGGAASPSPPVSSGPVMSFAAFLELRYPALPGMDEKTIALNAAAKNQRRDHKRVFTQSGQPGERFAPYRKRLIDALSLPPNLPPHLPLPHPLRDGRVFLLPCFFALLLHLEATGRDYGIVFRTFGKDLVDVSDELNRFADGTHPVYPRDKPGAVWPHLRSDAARHGGTFFRDAHTPAALVWGTLETVPPKHKHMGLTWYTHPPPPPPPSSSSVASAASSNGLLASAGAAAAAVSAAIAASSNGDANAGAAAASKPAAASAPLHHHVHVSPASPLSPAAAAHERDGVAPPAPKLAATATAAAPAALSIVRESYDAIYRSIVSRFWPTHAALNGDSAAAATTSGSSTAAVASSSGGGVGGAGSRGERVLLLHDYYEWWAANDEACDSGKLHVVDTRDSTLLSVFFDDNIERDDAHIVDTRDRHTGDVIPLHLSADRHTFKAEPLLSIPDPQYFIAALQKCERNFRACTFAQLQKQHAAAAAAAAAASAPPTISRSASPAYTADVAAAASSPALAHRRGLAMSPLNSPSPQFGAAAAAQVLLKSALVSPAGSALPSPPVLLVTPPASATPTVDEIAAAVAAAAAHATVKSSPFS